MKIAYLSIDDCVDCNNGIGFEPNEYYVKKPLDE